MTNKLLAALLLLQLGGCATVKTLNDGRPGDPLIYAGTRLDWYSLNGGCCPKDHFGTDAPAYPGLDLPGSALLDTLLLPLSLAAELGIGLQVWGGN
ncbi:YceK/YidQ family lipoprotein [Pseudomonas sp. LABIM340]|uniref:YceK/YidQ family lipoprotein n=1 Tax=Pseudomonas nitroreducens TaxID=46680 RepID=A0A5R9AL07_PSENT|nr:YceK/YidQ family lipoprotein [Pseudomonas nitroreducens]TLP78725.1 YceK/YidQ family lipoprotein [Pseudomonas nitroreducens]